MPAFLAKVLPTPSRKARIMSKLLFKLRHVPDDEAAEVRALLEENGIDFFETFAGSWGISFPALWLKDANQFTRARELLDVYQEERQTRMRDDFEQRRMRGEVKTLWHSFVESPLRFLVYSGLAGLVLFFSLQMFLSF